MLYNVGFSYVIPNSNAVYVAFFIEKNFLLLLRTVWMLYIYDSCRPNVYSRTTTTDY